MRTPRKGYYVTNHHKNAESCSCIVAHNMDGGSLSMHLYEGAIPFSHMTHVTNNGGVARYTTCNTRRIFQFVKTHTHVVCVSTKK